MKAYWQVGCVCLLLAGGLAMAAEATGAAATTRPVAAAETQPGKELIRGEYAIMVSELGLPEAQQQQLAEKLKARQDAVEAWEQANGKRLDQLERHVNEQPKDSPVGQQAREELKKLREDRDKLSQEQRAAIMSILTEDQQQKWEAFSLYRRVSRRYAWADLSKEAQEKTRELCRQAAKELRGVEDRDARAKVMDKLDQDIQSQVLSEQQRQQLQNRQARQRRATTQEAPTTKPAAEKPKE